MFPLVAQIATAPSCLEFREPSAREELLQLPRGRQGASRLLAALVRPEDARQFDQLALFERDRLIARLHAHCFGTTIEARVTCPRCDETADLRFDLEEFVTRVAAPIAADDLGLERRMDGSFVGPDGAAVRLPRVADETAVARLCPTDAEAYMREACLSLRAGTSPDRVEDWLEKLGPMIEASLDVNCAHCSAIFETEFDICGFFIDALASERPLVLREIHWLARFYGWSLTDLLDLPRSQRRQLVQLVLAEADRRGAA